MKCLLDTHALLWWLFDDPKLSQRARETIARPEHEILVSAASAWEIATKHRIGKLPEAGDVVGQFPAYLRKTRFTAFDISVDYALFAGSLPGPHRAAHREWSNPGVQRLSWAMTSRVCIRNVIGAVHKGSLSRDGTWSSEERRIPVECKVPRAIARDRRNTDTLQGVSHL